MRRSNGSKSGTRFSVAESRPSLSSTGERGRDRRSCTPSQRERRLLLLSGQRARVWLVRSGKSSDSENPSRDSATNENGRNRRNVPGILGRVREQPTCYVIAEDSRRRPAPSLTPS